MTKVTKIFLPIVAVAVLAGCSGGSSNKDAKNALELDSVNLSALDNKVVTYENTNGGATHEDTYCPNGMLGNTTGKDGTWIMEANGNDLTVTTIPPASTVTKYLTGTVSAGTLEKGKTYPTNGDSFKVTLIEETVCALILP